MARIRKVSRTPQDRNFFLIDANFLANRYIPPDRVVNPRERTRVERSREWWEEIDRQLKARKALVYVPDVCIAEAFKVLAKKYYAHDCFRYPVEYKRARDKLSKDIRISPKTLRGARRHPKFHDVQTSRDLILSVDRFFEVFYKHGLSVSIPDLLILSVSKFLLDFYGVPASGLFIVTLDNALWRGSKKFADIPTAFNPTKDLAARVFR